MARHMALWNKVRALEAELGGRGTKIVIRGGLSEGAQTPRNPAPEPESPSQPAEPASEGCANKPT